MRRFRTNNRLLALLVGVLSLLAACSNERKGDVLSPSKLEAILYDYHLAQVIVADLPLAQRYKKELYFAHVYKKHGVTKAEVDSSLVYYARYPEGLSEVYDNLSSRIEADIKRIENDDRPVRLREPVAVVGDSVDLWYDTRLVQMNSSPLAGNRYTFSIPTDTNFKSGDRLTWSGTVLFLHREVDSLRHYLHLDLRVKYLNDSIVSADTLLYTSGDFSIMVTDSAVVKSIDGTAYLNSADGAGQLLLVAPRLLRCRSEVLSDTLRSASLH